MLIFFLVLDKYPVLSLSGKISIKVSSVLIYRFNHFYLDLKMFVTNLCHNAGGKNKILTFLNNQSCWQNSIVTIQTSKYKI